MIDILSIDFVRSMLYDFHSFSDGDTPWFQTNDEYNVFEQWSSKFERSRRLSNVMIVIVISGVAKSAMVFVQRNFESFIP